MSTLLQILIVIYAAVNVFMCGNYYNDPGDDNSYRRVQMYLLLLFFGAIFVIVALCIIVFSKVYVFLDNWLQVGFYWGFYIANSAEYRRANIHSLYMWNKNSADNTFNPKHFRQRNYRNVVRIVSQYNGYVYDGKQSLAEFRRWERVDMIFHEYKANKDKAEKLFADIDSGFDAIATEL